MDLTWLDSTRLETRDIDAVVSVAEAARAVDAPYTLGYRHTQWAYRLRYGWDGDPPEIALYRNERGRVVGVVEVWLYKWDNTHVGSVNPIIDPSFRRQGIGRTLFDAGAERVRADGRRTLMADTYDSPGLNAFATAMGLTQASVLALRRQDLTVVDWPRLDKEYAEAEQHAAEYEMVRIAGSTPDDMLEAVATMTGAINDAPTDDLDIEAEVFTAERVRKFEEGQAARGRRLYRVVARHRQTGELAGHTMVGIDGERPWHCAQYDTSVVREHRGHRLGLLLKVDMMRWLAQDESQVRMLDTDNAASNSHMIAVNELLGYHVIGRMIEWQRAL